MHVTKLITWGFVEHPLLLNFSPINIIIVKQLKLGDPRTRFGNHCNDQSNSVSETASFTKMQRLP